MRRCMMDYQEQRLIDAGRSIDLKRLRSLVVVAVAVEVDSREWHLSPEDHAKTLARGRRIAIHQLNVLRFTPKQIRAEPARVVAEIRDALEGARGRPPLNLC